ncbi:MAG: alpha/beta hydrolase [Pseudomonadales bacterium]|nr:alpha/beta hydrolase [Pseudomonadales bacterium]
MYKWDISTGLAIAADVWGDPDGPLVILQHGGGQTRHAWKGTGETLGAAGYHAVAIDARGHGDSDWATGGVYGPDAMVKDLKCVIDILGGGKPTLVGASMGGNTSLVAIGEDHIEAAGLVLVDIAPKMEPEGIEKIGNFMGQKPEGFDSLEEVAEAIGNYQPHRTAPKNLQGLAKNVRLAENGKYRWHWDPAFRGQRPDSTVRQERMESCSKNLDVPVLLVRGGLSDVLSEAGAQNFLELCGHSEYVNVTDAGHMVAGDRNDVFANSVVDFLARTMPIA